MKIPSSPGTVYPPLRREARSTGLVKELLLILSRGRGIGRTTVFCFLLPRRSFLFFPCPCMRRYIIFFLSLCVLGGSVLFFLGHGWTEINVLPGRIGVEEQNFIPVTLVIERVPLVLAVREGSTVLSVLEKARDASFITFSGREYPGMGFFVQEINKKGKNARDGKYWVYSINGKKAIVGVSLYMIKPQDVISWNYENDENL